MQQLACVGTLAQCTTLPPRKPCHVQRDETEQQHGPNIDAVVGDQRNVELHNQHSAADEQHVPE